VLGTYILTLMATQQTDQSAANGSRYRHVPQLRNILHTEDRQHLQKAENMFTESEEMIDDLCLVTRGFLDAYVDGKLCLFIGQPLEMELNQCHLWLICTRLQELKQQAEKEARGVTKEKEDMWSSLKRHAKNILCDHAAMVEFHVCLLGARSTPSHPLYNLGSCFSKYFTRNIESFLLPFFNPRDDSEARRTLSDYKYWPDGRDSYILTDDSCYLSSCQSHHTFYDEQFEDHCPICKHWMGPKVHISIVFRSGYLSGTLTDLTDADCKAIEAILGPSADVDEFACCSHCLEWNSTTLVQFGYTDDEGRLQRERADTSALLRMLDVAKERDEFDGSAEQFFKQRSTNGYSDNMNDIASEWNMGSSDNFDFLDHATELLSSHFDYDL
jgi:hypothetical protein